MILKKYNHIFVKILNDHNFKSYQNILIILGFSLFPKGTFSVKFGIYMCQTTILRGVLYNCPTYFLHPINI
jgi:hypothetical protein